MALFGAALCAVQARAEFINFDNLPTGPTDGFTITNVTNQYLNVTFSASGGDIVMITSQAAYNTSPPNMICTGSVAGVVDCAQDLIMTFSVPVNNLVFDALGNQTAIGGTFATADIFQNFGLAPTTTVQLLVQPGGGNHNADHQDLSAFANITKLVIHETTFEAQNAGSSFDNIGFTPADTTIPEPSTLLLTGSLGLLWIGRRFLARQRA